MGEQIKKNLFDICTKYKGYDLYKKLIEYVSEEIEDAKGNQASCFYDTLTELETSINNTGWETRHSEQIDYIVREKSKMSEQYKGFID